MNAGVRPAICAILSNNTEATTIENPRIAGLTLDLSITGGADRKGLRTNSVTPLRSSAETSPALCGQKRSEKPTAENAEGYGRGRREKPTVTGSSKSMIPHEFGKIIPKSDDKMKCQR